VVVLLDRGLVVEIRVAIQYLVPLHRLVVAVAALTPLAEIKTEPQVVRVAVAHITTEPAVLEPPIKDMLEGLGQVLIQMEVLAAVVALGRLVLLGLEKTAGMAVRVLLLPLQVLQ
jgi:hypothetical protein